MTPTKLKKLYICVLLLTFCVSNLFCFTLLLWKSAIYMDTVFLRKSSFFSTTVWQTGHPCHRWNVGLHAFHDYVDAMKHSFMFCFFGLLYLRFSSLYKKNYFAWLRQGLLSRSLKSVTHLLDWLFGLSSPMLSLCCLVIWPSRSKRFKFSGPCLLKKGTHLGHWPTFLSLTVREFSHFYAHQKSADG